MAQIKKDTSLRKAILQAAITGQLISDIGGESDVLFSNEKKSKTKLDSEADLPLASRVSKRNSVVSDSERTTPSAGTPRNAPTETGKELLDRIIEERNNKLLAEWKEALKKNPKAKKPALVVASEIDEEEIPFEIPENWCWCRLGDLISISSGDMLTSSQMKNGKIPVYGGNGITGYHNVSNIHEETIVIGRVGFYCGSVHLTEKEAWVTDNAFTTSYSKKCLNREYLIIALRQLDLGRQQNKTAQPVVSGKKIYPMIFPLPPLSVQNAIVVKLEQVLPLVDAYENALLQKEELKSALPDKVKKAILQEAITGKLTETWRKSATIKESGKQLLDRIIEERNAKALADWEETLKKNVGGKATLPSFASKTRAKKPVPVVASEIDEEEIPFEVPESWCWCHLGEIFKVTMGQSPEGSNVGEEKEGMEFHQGKIFFTDKYIATSNQKTSEITKIAEPGSILLCMRAPVGKVNITDRQICIGRGLSSIVPLGEIALEWAFHLFETLESDFIDKSTGSTFKAITGDVVKEQLIPLPPLEEQQEIVKKVEELLELCK